MEWTERGCGIGGHGGDVQEETRGTEDVEGPSYGLVSAGPKGRIEATWVGRTR